MTQSKVFSTNKTLNLNGRLVDLTVPVVMGILNITPDSFYSESRFTDQKSILLQAGKMLLEGATIIDVGGYSTRPGAADITEDEELNRVIPALETIIREFPDANLSIDTFRSKVAYRAVATGACMVNDISGGGLDERMFETVAGLRVPYVLMHMRGTPKTMNKLTGYEDLFAESLDYFHRRIRTLRELNVADVIVDPGFGFAKTADQNFDLLNKLEYYGVFGKPVLAGLSRKSMIWRSLDTDPERALNGTTSLNTLALAKRAAILRVHDVKEAVESIRLFMKTQVEGSVQIISEEKKPQP